MIPISNKRVGTWVEPGRHTERNWLPYNRLWTLHEYVKQNWTQKSAKRCSSCTGPPMTWKSKACVFMYTLCGLDQRSDLGTDVVPTSYFVPIDRCKLEVVDFVLCGRLDTQTLISEQ